MTQPRRIALVTVDCFESGAAVQRLGELLGEELAVVIDSDTARATSTIRGGLQFMRRSGIRFMLYMFLNFHAYERLCWLLELIVGRKAPTQTLRFWCNNRNVPYRPCKNVNSDDVRAELRDAGVTDILVYFSDQIIRSELIEEYHGRIVNLHAAYLPHYKGVFPVFWAFMRGETSTGVTLHRIVDESIDTGPILRQMKVPLDSRSDALSSARSVNVAGVEMVYAALNSGATREPGTIQWGGAYFSYPTHGDVTAFAQGRRFFSVWAFLREILAPNASAAERRANPALTQSRCR